MPDPSRAQTVVGIQGQNIFSPRSEDTSIPRRSQSFVFLPDNVNSFRRQFLHFLACPLVCGTVIDDNKLNVAAPEIGDAGDCLLQKFTMIETWDYD
jgi:hypothetical protein